nr:MAG TPA: hypothetical protein [Caudoviricetes sp.]
MCFIIISNIFPRLFIFFPSINLVFNILNSFIFLFL